MNKVRNQLSGEFGPVAATARDYKAKGGFCLLSHEYSSLLGIFQASSGWQSVTRTTVRAHLESMLR